MNLECRIESMPGDDWTNLPAPQQCTGLEFLYNDGSIEASPKRSRRDNQRLPNLDGTWPTYTELAYKWRYADHE